MSNNNFRSSWHHKLDIIVTAFVFIMIGILLIARNMGIINDSIYHFLVSWQMLLIVIGVVQLIKHKVVGGAVLITIGVYFLFSRFPWWSVGPVLTFWPVVFIFTGLLILLTKVNRGPGKKKFPMGNDFVNKTTTEDGFVNSEVAFGSAQQIVFDPYFKGARLYNSFGGIVLDLRRTKLIETDTFIEVDSSFGGIEILVPADWNVIVNVNSTLSGFHDKRFKGYDDSTDPEHRVIIQGQLTCSGLEIKN